LFLVAKPDVFARLILDFSPWTGFCSKLNTAQWSYNALATGQEGDNELRTLRGSTTALRLEKIPVSGTTVSIYCDTSAGRY
jgi:hypothetical protein